MVRVNMPVQYIIPVYTAVFCDDCDLVQVRKVLLFKLLKEEEKRKISCWDEGVSQHIQRDIPLEVLTW